MILDYEEFMAQLVSCVKEQLAQTDPLGLYRVELGTVSKLNGQKLDSISLRCEGREMVPTSYFKQLYQIYETGTKIEELAGQIIDLGMDDLRPEIEHFPDITDFEKIKDNICMKLINKAKNEEMLKETPHIEFLDLAVVYYVLVISGEGVFQATVSEKVLKVWGKEKDDLIKTAAENTRNLNPESVKSMEEMIRLSEEEGLLFQNRERAPELFCVSSTNCRNGAVYMLDMRIMEKVAEEFDDDIIIIPSSIHEVFLLPASQNEREKIDISIKEVNENCLDENDYLSDHSYMYIRDKKKIVC